MVRRAIHHIVQRDLDLEFATGRDELIPITPGCLLYTSDAADERSSVDLGGRRIIKKKNKQPATQCSLTMPKSNDIVKSGVAL